MANPALFSSDQHDWETPDELFAALDAEFGFDVDVCATAATAKCRHFFSPDQDGSKKPWRGICLDESPVRIRASEVDGESV